MKLQKSVSDKLIAKIKSDLQQGVKILGNYSSQSDSIRVWTSFNNTEFGVVATSSRRFKTTFDLIEIQAFLTGKQALKMTILHKNGKTEIDLTKLGKNYLPIENTAPNEKEILNFLENYMHSAVDKNLGKRYFERSFRNPERYRWLDSELRK
ncbi:MAG: hypothetical protein ABIE03_02030 [Patescibacteria group bacterium]|nr:hypothetical protein [Patescibacteria group bacterium]